MPPDQDNPIFDQLLKLIHQSIDNVSFCQFIELALKDNPHLIQFNQSHHTYLYLHQILQHYSAAPQLQEQLLAIIAMIEVAIEWTDDVLDNELTENTGPGAVQVQFMTNGLLGCLLHSSINLLPLSEQSRHQLATITFNGIMAIGQLQFLELTNQLDDDYQPLDQVDSTIHYRLTFYTQMVMHSLAVDRVAADQYLRLANMIGRYGRMVNDVCDMYQDEQCQDIINHRFTFPIRWHLSGLDSPADQQFLDQYQAVNGNLEKALQIKQCLMQANGLAYADYLLTTQLNDIKQALQQTELAPEVIVKISQSMAAKHPWAEEHNDVDDGT